jgi:carbamoyl-phosphate synthase small subunit
MSNLIGQSAVLLLQDGTVFYGKAAGKIGTTVGEICFNTGMTGYQEVFTDPSYFGQILVATNVHIGNYGTKKADTESNKVQIAGLVTRQFQSHYSRPQADAGIQEYFEEQAVVGISDIDTRAVVRHIRQAGAMNAIISSEELDLEVLKAQLAASPSMDGLELASRVSTEAQYVYGPADAKFTVVAVDFGIKENILRCFVDRGCRVLVFPAKTPVSVLMDQTCDGYFLSNGPGDPAAMDYAIETVQQLLKTDKPMFGICLGHQLLALALGFPTYKMHNGHRGINHPVKNLVTGHCEITSQNHGFCVDPTALSSRPDLIEVTHVNLNDDTIEGFKVKDRPVFSVQYHPEAAPGPHDARYLFDDFVNLMTVSETVTA